MATMLSMDDVEELAARQAEKFDPSMTRDRVHVYEDPYSFGVDSLVVQIAARRLEDWKEWIGLRLRVAHGLRDALLERGDERYPLLQIFEPEEWAGRNDRAG